MSDRKIIYLDDAIDALDIGAELLRRVLYGADIVGAEREKIECELALIESCISDIKALPSAQQWIPCSKRMPEDGQDVLFYDIDNDVMKGYHVKGRPKTHFSQDGTYEDIKNVIAWMPLPEPWRGEE